MEKHEVEITAKNSEQFAKAEELLNKLPESIICQIISAQFGGVGLECVIKDLFTTNQRITLPNKVTQMSDFDEYIGIYCEPYFFVIKGDLYKKKHSFTFVECEKL